MGQPDQTTIVIRLQLLLFQDVGRVKIELFADIVPKTAENFRYGSCTKCTGYVLNMKVS